MLKAVVKHVRGTLRLWQAITKENPALAERLMQSIKNKKEVVQK